MARQVRERGGIPLLLPGLSLRGADHPAEAAVALRAALDDDVLVFTSPAAVRFAARLARLQTKATVFAVGQGTARALRRLGVTSPWAPERRQDSEGLLDHPLLADLQGRHVALISAPGGRGVLRAELVVRGAQLREVHVYRRTAPRWQKRQLDAVKAMPADARVLLSSAEAVGCLREGLPAVVFSVLCGSVAVVSSQRLAQVAREAGFARVVVAASAMGTDLLVAAAL